MRFVNQCVVPFSFKKDNKQCDQNKKGETTNSNKANGYWSDTWKIEMLHYDVFNGNVFELKVVVALPLARLVSA